MNLLAPLRRNARQRRAIALVAGYALALHVILLGLAVGSSAAVAPGAQISCLGHSIPGPQPAGGDQHSSDASCIKACSGAALDLTVTGAPARSAPMLPATHLAAPAAGIADAARILPSARGPPGA
jgi:hypothetical protein